MAPAHCRLLSVAQTREADERCGRLAAGALGRLGFDQIEVEAAGPGEARLDAVPAVLDLVLAVLYPVVHLLGDGAEGLLDVEPGLGAGLDVVDAVLVGERAGLLARDLAPAAVRDEVELAADQAEDRPVGLDVPARLQHPARDVLEARPVAHVVDQERAHAVAVVRFRYGPADG